VSTDWKFEALESQTKTPRTHHDQSSRVHRNIHLVAMKLRRTVVEPGSFHPNALGVSFLKDTARNGSPCGLLKSTFRSQLRFKMAHVDLIRYESPDDSYMFTLGSERRVLVDSHFISIEIIFESINALESKRRRNRAPILLEGARTSTTR
jgi:hypothetical protein